MLRQQSGSQRGPVLFEGLSDTEFQSRLATTTDTKPQPQRPDFDPQWLIYLPPTMSSTETTEKPGLLEHPAEAFAYFRSEGVPRLVCEEKHMGSRAVVVVCRGEVKMPLDGVSVSSGSDSSGRNRCVAYMNASSVSLPPKASRSILACSFSSFLSPYNFCS
jgi:hypothetical protein